MGKSTRKTHLEHARVFEEKCQSEYGNHLGYQILFHKDDFIDGINDSKEHANSALEYLKQSGVVPKDTMPTKTDDGYELVIDDVWQARLFEARKVFRERKLNFPDGQTTPDKKAPLIAQGIWKVVLDRNTQVPLFTCKIPLGKKGGQVALRVAENIVRQLKKDGILPKNYYPCYNYTVKAATLSVTGINMDKLMQQDYFKDLLFPAEDVHPLQNPALNKKLQKGEDTSPSSHVTEADTQSPPKNKGAGGSFFE